MSLNTCISFHGVKEVRIEATRQGHESVNRGIEITLNDGSRIQIDLFSPNDELKVEIE